MSFAWDCAGLDVGHWLQRSVDARIRLSAAPYMVGWGYSSGSPRVAYESPGVPSSLVLGSRVTNCSTLTASILTSVFADRPWSGREYGDLQVFADRLPNSPDAPIRAAERMAVATPVEELVRGRWHLVQGWRSLGSSPSGHAFFALAGDDIENPLVLEATSIDGEGPRYKQKSMADLRDYYRTAMYFGLLPTV